jgi:hypothetical protein
LSYACFVWGYTLETYIVTGIMERICMAIAKQRSDKKEYAEKDKCPKMGETESSFFFIR